MKVAVVSVGPWLVEEEFEDLMWEESETFLRFRT
jgi:hypothetical protein